MSFAAGLGARGQELSDGRFVITEVTAGSPAKAAGWRFGTEILAVNGTPIGDRIGALPLFFPAGNPELIRLAQAGLTLGFADGERATITFLQPDGTVTRTAEMVAGLVTDPEPEVDTVPAVPGLFETRELDGGNGYVTCCSRL